MLLSSYPAQIRWLAATCLIFLLLSQSSDSPTQEFPSELSEQKWELKTSRFECRLDNRVAGLGNVVLNAAAGNINYIALDPDIFFKESRRIKIALQQSPWQHKQYLKPLGENQTSAEKQFDMEVNVAHIVEALQQGRQLVIEIKRGGVEPLIIKTPAVEFQNTATEFYECFGQLLTLSFDQAKDSLLYYSSSKSRISSEQLQHLDDLAAYILADKDIVKIEVDAHTDSRGAELSNRELSKTRATRVSNYLVEKGVPKSKILIRFHGERYPVANNNTPEGRNKNRRVKITLSRR